MKLGELKAGDKYANGKYLVRDNDGQSMGVLRLIDNWFIRFYEGSINWNHNVEKV